MMRGPHRMRASLKIFMASMLVALAIAGPAMAANPTQNGYTLRAGVTETSIQNPAPPKAVVQSRDNGGGLPFTGLQISVVLGIGVALLGAGLMVRRLSSTSQLS